MRWKTKRSCKFGDRRQTIRFSWLPHDTTDGMTVWLERYICMEHFCVIPGIEAGWKLSESFSKRSTMWQERKGKL